MVVRVISYPSPDNSSYVKQTQGLPNHDHITHAKGPASGNCITNTNTGWSGGGVILVWGPNRYRQ